MRKILASIQKKLQNQLIATFVSLTAIMTIILISFSYHVFSNASQKTYIESSSMLLSQLKTNVTAYFSAIDQATLQLYSDAMLSPEHYTYKTDDYVSYNYILKKLQNIYMQNISTNYICLYLTESEEFFVVNQYYNYSTHVASSLLASDVFQQIADSNSMLILSDFDQHVFPEEFQSSTDENTITVARSIKFDKRPGAFLFINYSTDSLCQALAENVDANSSILLCDLSGNYIASSSHVAETLDTAILQMTGNIQGTFQIGTGNDAKLYLYQKMENYPLMLIKQIPMHAILHQAHSMRTALIILAFFFILVTAVIIIWISFYMTSRIVSLKKCINTVADGDFNIQLVIKGKDEISDISRAFFDMSQKIQHLIQEKYVAELASQRATLNALTAQINPHFLYNTLQTISSIAREENVPDIEIMMTSLSNMMRYTIKPVENMDEQITTISRELQNCEDYLKLLSYRYADRLLYSIKMDPEAADLLIPRLSLQPLIENSMVHGIDDKVASCILLIHAHMENGVCTISVSDNGQGICGSKLASIRQALTANESSGHLGLQNVYTRFQILYADAFKFEIDSIPYRKTNVEISILKPKKEIK